MKTKIKKSMPLDEVEMCRGCIYNDGFSCNNDPAPDANGKCSNHATEEENKEPTFAPIIKNKRREMMADVEERNMIKTDEEYQSAKNALEDVEKALMALKKKVYGLSPERYHLMAEPYTDLINKLRQDINCYLGIASTKISDSIAKLEGRCE